MFKGKEKQLSVARASCFRWGMGKSEAGGAGQGQIIQRNHDFVLSLLRSY